MTGQDATLVGLQNILAGYQCGTVYKPIYLEAQAAVALAMYLRAGKTPPSALVNGPRPDSQESKQVPSVLLTPEWVTPSNMNSTVIADQFVPAQQLCVGSYASRLQGCWNLGMTAHQEQPEEARPVTNPSADDARPAEAGRASAPDQPQEPYAPQPSQAHEDDAELTAARAETAAVQAETAAVQAEVAAAQAENALRHEP